MPASAPPTLALAHELRETIGRLVRRLRAEHGPPVGLLAVLGRLDRDGPASISDLAAAERMRPQSMAQIVRDLEGEALVSRRPDPEDGRRAFVELTEAGAAKLQANRAAREDWLSETLERRPRRGRARAPAPGRHAAGARRGVLSGGRAEDGRGRGAAGSARPAARPAGARQRPGTRPAEARRRSAACRRRPGGPA